MLLVSSSLGYESELNALSTLEMIVKSLPLTMRQNWARVTDELLEQGNRLHFEDLQRFIESEARIFSSQFGQLARSKAIVPRNVLNINQSNSTIRSPGSCPSCSETHALDLCSKFLQLSISARWKLAKSLRVCFACLNTGHLMSVCKIINSIRHDCCTSKFHKVFHDHQELTHSVNKFEGHNYRSSLGVLPVRVIGPNGEFETHALLDNGSEITLIQRDLVDQMGCLTNEAELKVTSALCRSDLRVGLTSIEVAPLDRKSSIKVDNAYVIPKLTINHSRISKHDLSHWTHLKDLGLDSIPNEPVKLLIGTDVPMAHWPIDRRLGGSKDPFAIQTPLGWVFLGPNKTSKDEVACCNITVQDSFEKLYNSEFEDVYIEGSTLSKDERRAQDLVADSLRFNAGHYEIPLPWRHEPSDLPFNYESAKQRLLQLRRRLIRDPVYKEKYIDEIRKLRQKGYASLAPVERPLVSSNPKWYLPHHGVVNPRKPEKLRIVLDCAASYQGISLNSFLYQGPDINTSLINVLLRFRLEHFAVSADIAEMFIQIRVAESDRSALRFLWWADEGKLEEIVELQMNSHPFGATSSPFCANFALRQAIKDLNESGSPLVARAADYFYVDDLLASFADIDEARGFVGDITHTLAKGGFTLCKWVSNHQTILTDAPTLLDSNMSVLLSGCQSQRTLGLEWFPSADYFKFSFNALTTKTRRGILSAVSSVFDPLGLISPLILVAKFLLQRLCRQGLQWDTELNSVDQEVWSNWCCAMNGLKSLQIPRCIRSSGCAGIKPEIHVFSDASERAYGAAIYAFFGSENKHCSLLFSKARVAPLKSVTIPRLELAAATLAARLASKISKIIDIDIRSFNFWTDSMIVIYYLNNVRSRYTIFVANRITVIMDITDPSQWRHVRSEYNPADLVSRGTTDIKEVVEWNEWKGRRNLPLEEDKHPMLPHTIPSGVEYKKEKICLNTAKYEDNFIDRLALTSSWSKILKNVAWMTRFTKYVSVMFGKNNKGTIRLGRLSLSEIEQAEHKLLQLCQRSYYPKLCINHNNVDNIVKVPLKDTEKQLKCLNLVTERGLIKVGGRIFPYNRNHFPILVPPVPLAHRIAVFYHELYGHCGPSQLLACLRERYWIVRGRNIVKQVLSECWTCKRMNCQPTQQMMAPLSPYRFEPGWSPFTHVGVDYFGPFRVTQHRKTEKVYACLFTCLQIRAVHVEVVNWLTTDSFILALTRFIARRGCPRVFYSDNGTNLVGATRELNIGIKSLDTRKISDCLLDLKVQWEFNPPSASHRGGLWERMIRSVRKILWNILGDKSVSLEVLSSTLIQAEGILNKRPIVPVTSPSLDHTFLTPNHLLLLRSSDSDIIPDRVSDIYRKRWHQVNSLAKQFWDSWVKEYVPTLKNRQKWLKEKRNLKVDDVVLLVGENKSRNQWDVGVIHRVFPSVDGLVRTVEVKTKQGFIIKDVRKVCLLEAAGENGAPDNL